MTSASDDNHLLDQAQFLTQFQDFYSYGEPALGAITPKDLRAVFDYRGLCRRVHDATEDARVKRLNDGETLIDRPAGTTSSDVFRRARRRVRQRRGEDPLDRHIHQKAAVERNARLMECDALLTRFEVWTTKALTQELLVSQDKPEAYNVGSLLSIPSSTYMKSVLEDHGTVSQTVAPERGALAPFACIWNSAFNDSNQQGKQTRQLAITPDALTWPEFLRVSYMISLLPTESLRKQVHSSLCTLGPAGGKEWTHSNYQFRSTDLVALWVRAQFCSASRRYLRELYQVAVVDNEGKDDSNPPSYKAIYRGNHRSMPRCFSETPLVDTLVRWAVLNQVLFTQPKVLEAYKHGREAKPRTRSQLAPVSNKKRRTQATALSSWECQRLIQACQSFLLRDFCRRHPITTVLLYASKEEYDYAQESLRRRKDRDIVEPSLVLHHPQAQEMIDSGVLSHIRDRPLYEKFSDRKLPRIDRRILFGGCKKEVASSCFRSFSRSRSHFLLLLTKIMTPPSATVLRGSRATHSSSMCTR
jgi:hypothetical protein